MLPKGLAFQLNFCLKYVVINSNTLNSIPPLEEDFFRVSHVIILLMVQKCGDHQLSLVVYPIINRVLYTPGDLPTQAWFYKFRQFCEACPTKRVEFSTFNLTWSRDRVKISKEPVFVFFLPIWSIVSWKWGCTQSKHHLWRVRQLVVSNWILSPKNSGYKFSQSFWNYHF